LINWVAYSSPSSRSGSCSAVKTTAGGKPAVHAGFEYFQRETGYTRTGSHNKRVHDWETGQWHEADLSVAHWLQHKSRDGDMQLHVHSQIAHVAAPSPTLTCAPARHGSSSSAAARLRSPNSRNSRRDRTARREKVRSAIDFAQLYAG
jgi:hypothetical protein